MPALISSTNHTSSRPGIVSAATVSADGYGIWSARLRLTHSLTLAGFTAWLPELSTYATELLVDELVEREQKIGQTRDQALDVLNEYFDRQPVCYSLVRLPGKTDADLDRRISEVTFYENPS